MNQKQTKISSDVSPSYFYKNAILFQSEFQVYRIVVGVRISCIDVLIRNAFYIIRYNRGALIRFTSIDIVEEHIGFDSTIHSVYFNDLMSVIQRCAEKSCCIDSVMYYANGYSYDEISEILNIPVGTVRSRISSGRKFLLHEIGY